MIRDNIDDVLVKIIQFTHIRHDVILKNIEDCRCADFAPRNVDVEDFARVISAALAEHQKSKRLALCDSRTVSFTGGGRLNIKLKVDTAAQRLFEQDFDQYLRFQRRQLDENAINNKTACALLSHKLKSSKVAVR
ncbi:MAG: hypothetical protein A2167_08920 [Planctomycetes bacterium RBG_13_46_10]|nr:MAG: hypothetical protein A2167_08920 [Planctomycetes bacterium RBG_13_46_10]